MSGLGTNSIELSEAALAEYNEKGFLLVENILPPKVCDRLVTEADQQAEGRYTSVLDMHFKSPLFHSLITDMNILSLADRIQQARMIPIGSIFFYCRPENPLEQGSLMHQDNYAPKAPYGSYMVIGVALDEADRENGALIIYPGSHKLGDLPNQPSKNFEYDEDGNVAKAYPFGNEVKIPEGYKPLQLSYSRGSLLFLHGHTVHGAPKNPSKTRWRRKIYMHYIKDGDPFWPGWNARRRLIERPDSPAS